MRRFLSLALPMTLLACNGGSKPPAPRPRASPTPATPATDTATPPRPLPLTRFGDWAVGCDNGGTCQAGSLMPEDGDAPALTLSIERGPGPDAPVAIHLRSQATITLPLTAKVDGEAVARGGTQQGEVIALTGAPAMALAAKLAAGKALTLIDAGGATVTLPLKGASAALRWIDDRQGRVGTTGALVARGGKPDTRPVPPLPVVRAATIRGEAALLDPLLITRMREMAGCDDDDLPDVTTKTLDGPRTLAIVPCAQGAYNTLSALFVIERGTAVPVSFDAPVAGGSDGDLVYNATFEDGILDTVAKGRGLGDCGVMQRYAWDGTRFRLIELREMAECRGNPDFIRTWTARVIR